MMAIALLSSVFLICVTWLAHTYFLIEFKERMRRHVDNAKLSLELEKKLVEMDDLKLRMNQLLLKHGLGR